MRAQRLSTFIQWRFEALEDRRLLAAAPVGVSDKYTVLAGEMLVDEPGVLANDFDADGDPLSAVLVGAPRYGAVALAPDGGFRYLPNPGFAGDDTFLYRVRAADGESALATVTITVRAASNFDLWSREFGGNGHGYAVVSRRLTWQDARLAAEQVTFGGSAGYLTTITSKAEADQILRQGASEQRAWLGGYQDHDAPDYSEPKGGWRWVTGEPFAYAQWTPGEPNEWPNDGGEDFLETLSFGTNFFLWNDVHSSYGFGGFSVEVPAPTPFAGDDLFQVAVDQPRIVEAPGYLTNDRYGHASVALEVVQSTSHGVLEVQNDGGLRYVPDAGFSGRDSFTYRITTADGDSNLATATFKVGLDEFPSVTKAYHYGGTEDEPIATRGTFRDPLLDGAFDRDSTALRVELVSGPLHGSVAIDYDGHFVYTPTPNYAGSDEFTFVVVDGPSRSAPTRATFTLAFVDDPVSTTADRYEFVGAGPFDVASAAGVLASDVDPDRLPLSADVVRNTGHGVLTLATDGGFRYQPTAGFRGVDRFTYRTFDFFSYSPETTVLLAVDTVFGDANGDAQVNLDDFGALKASFGKADATLAQGDIDGDADVDLDDFGLLKQNFGRGSAREQAAAGALPNASQNASSIGPSSLGWLRWAWDQRSAKPEQGDSSP